MIKILKLMQKSIILINIDESKAEDISLEEKVENQTQRNSRS